MKKLIIILLFICGQVKAQVPLVLKGVNTEYFKVFVYEIKYHYENDSIKIDNFLLTDIQANKQNDITYEVNLPLKNWYLIAYLDIENREKAVIIKTGNFAVKEPMVFTADFTNTNDYDVDYDPVTNSYSGRIISIR